MFKAYVNYWISMVKYVLKGEKRYFIWLAFLGIWILLGGVAYYDQFINGLIVTNLTDQVSWGAYIANFTYLVGVADAAVLLIFAAYVMNHDESQEVVILGVLLAVAAIIACLLFITVDLGRPDRFLHIMPPFGKLNFPISILAWDVVVLNGYLFLNLHIPGYLLYMQYRGKEPNKWLYTPFIWISIAWAVIVHTVTAFLYSGLGGRPYWNSAILAPRFLISSFGGGAAVIILVLTAVSVFTTLKVKEAVFKLMLQILKIFLPINMFLFGCEIYKEFYTNSVHTMSMTYLLFGVHGHHMLVPYIWSAIIMETIAVVIIFTDRFKKNNNLILLACLFSVLGIWIEKGMGLIVPGFIPTPLGDMVEYAPSVHEFFISAGIWGVAALVFTVLAKVAIAIQTGRLREGN